ncbi:MAG: hypothetical protein H7A45_14915 [Verrucomicrobiales bacterium]|nr:hypothetical protein [Verrucomicrobiales bacterium]MCP5526147.1 hypothetical protein [Verrucomicrobiales bacterium]
MKTSDFEERLRRQPRAEPPAHWRNAVIDAAVAALPCPAPDRPHSGSPGWLGWLRPARLGWIGLAAAWMLILLLNHAARPEPLPAAFSDGGPVEVWSTWESHQRVLARQLELAPEPGSLPHRSGPGRQSALPLTLPFA